MHESPAMDRTGRTTAPTKKQTHDEVVTGSVLTAFASHPHAPAPRSGQEG
jgi:hypothetical protein